MGIKELLFVTQEVYDKYIANKKDKIKIKYAVYEKNTDENFEIKSVGFSDKNLRLVLPERNFTRGSKKDVIISSKETLEKVKIDPKDISLDAIKPEIGGKINNPITRSFESGMGKGLAGFIDSLGVDYNDEASTWEIDKDSMAPKLINITIGFTPIHDIPLGIDEEGMMTAPAYNVGEINKQFFGDVYDDYDDEG